jgi:Flp pilus assembly protein TadD
MVSIPEILSLGLRAHQAGHFNQAEQLYQQILQANPQHPDALHLLGVLISQRGRDDLAVPYIEQALAVKPNVAAFCNNLGFSYLALKRLDEAEAVFQQAIGLQPDFSMAHNNLGNVHRAKGQWAEATVCYREAVRLQPDYPEANGNLGVALQELGKPEEALVWYDQSLRLNPDHAETHVNRAMLWLVLGKLEEGWEEFEWRWRTKDLPGYFLRQPRWDGSDLHGRTIFIYAEQGLGDTFQFIRFLPLVIKRGGTIVLECQKPLLLILSDFSGVDQLFARGSQPPAFDVHIPLMSLAGIFHTTLESIPLDIPYLHADCSLVNRWRNMSGVRCPVSGVSDSSSDSGHRTPDSGRCFRVGIAWQGNAGKPFDCHRSMPLAHFAHLARVPGVRLISLQKGQGVEQLQSWTSDTGLRTPDNLSSLDEESGAFMDTAAVMQNVDLIISSDTAVPHLAGAMGIPVWVALPLASDWRWLVQREDSPWYPTMRLFRQTQYGDWDSVFTRIAAELKKVATDGSRMNHGQKS